MTRPTVILVAAFAVRTVAVFAVFYTVCVLAAVVFVDPATGTGVDYANYLTDVAYLSAAAAVVVAGIVAFGLAVHAKETTE